MTVAELETALLQTQAELAAVKATLGSFIVWVAQSANSPISQREASMLLEKLPQERST